MGIVNMGRSKGINKPVQKNAAPRRVFYIGIDKGPIVSGLTSHCYGMKDDINVVVFSLGLAIDDGRNAILDIANTS